MKKPIQEILKINPSQLNAYSTGLLQGKAYRILNTSLQKVLTRFDMGIPEWKLLGQLYDHGNMRLSDMAERLYIEPPTVTEFVDTLEKKHFVVRRNDATDKRVKIIGITDKGRLVIEEMDPPVKQAMALLLKGVERSELLSYIRVLQAICDNGQE